MIKNEFTDKELIVYRKENYWRGFRVACFVLIPVIVFLVIIIHKLVLICI